MTELQLVLESLFKASDAPQLNTPVNTTFPDGVPVWVTVARLGDMQGVTRLRAVADALVSYGFVRFTLLEEPDESVDIYGEPPFCGEPLIAPATQVALVDAVTLLGEVLDG